MQVIQTSYKGYAFRSRLEARWAVFFDSLGITWQYEVEGFEFKNGLRYLPDFWLPDFNMWVEVKGVIPKVDYTGATHTEPSVRKLEALRSESGYGCLLVGPDPLAYTPWIGFDSKGETTFKLARFRIYHVDNLPHLSIASEDEDSNDAAYTSRSIIKASDSRMPRLLVAVKAFRSASFEFKRGLQ